MAPSGRPGLAQAHGGAVIPPVRLVEERRFDPPRQVLVEHDGRWWPGLLHPASQFILIEATPYMEAALEKFARQPSAVSYTDCMVMAVADAYHTRAIFGFDRQLEDAGYQRLTPANRKLPDAA